MAQGMLDGRPHSSALMKFASRPKNRPIGVAAAQTSSTLQESAPTLRANSTMATIEPIRPPWNAMPPFQTAGISSGLLK